MKEAVDLHAEVKLGQPLKEGVLIPGIRNKRFFTMPGESDDESDSDVETVLINKEEVIDKEASDSPLQNYVVQNIAKSKKTYSRQRSNTFPQSP